MGGIIKILVLFGILVIAQCLTPEEKEQMLAIHRGCGMSDEVSENAFRGQFPDDGEFKAHVFCISKKLGVQNEMGELQVQFITDMLHNLHTDDNKVEEILSKCMVQRSTPEESAFEALTCMHNVRAS
nr:odorant binding protein 21 [Aromia bungii]